MNKFYSKIAALSVGLAMAIGVGVAVGSKEVRVAKADDTAIMTFDFEEQSAHRTSGNNSYSSTPNVYEENGADITLIYADSITTGSPLAGSANICARVGKGTTNSPSVVIGPIDLSNYAVSGFSYNTKSVGSLTVASSYSVDGTNYTAAESHAGNSTAAVKSASGLSIIEESAVYLKFVVTITNGQSTTGNRDTQIDDVKIIGHSTGSNPLESISCSSQSIDVTKTLDLASKITFTPSDAANKSVSFAIKENNGNIEMTPEGIITGLKGGSATVTITPEDTSGGASPIDVAVTVNSISSPALTVGDQYVIYAVDDNDKYSYSGELSGVEGNLGTVSEMSGEIPACSYVLTAVEGYFENTVAFSDGSKYLSLNVADNKLHTSDSVTANSSWIVSISNENEADHIHIINTAFQGREIRFNYNNNSPRFACYGLDTQVEIQLYHYVNKSLEDFSIESEVNVYVSDTRTIAVTYDPADASDKELTWVSANEGVATVNENGVVTGVAVGETIITASKTIQGVLVERTCTVSVLNNVASHHGTSADPFNVEDAVKVANGIFTKDPDGNPISLENSYYVEGMITMCNSRTRNQLTLLIGDNASQISVALGAFQVYHAASVYGVALSNAYATDNDVKTDFNKENYVKVYSTLALVSGTPRTTEDVADVVYCDYIEARKYAEVFNAAFEAEGVCDSDGKSTDVENLASIWGGQSSNYSKLDDHSKAILAGTEGKTTSGATAVEKCAAKYDYIGGKYNTQLGAEYDFMGRNPSPVASGRISDLSIEAGNNTMIIVVIIASVSALAFTTLLVFKKKKQK